MARDDAVTAIGFPIRLLTVALLLTITTFAGCVWIVLNARRDALATIAALVVGGISFLAWFLAVRSVQRWRMTLERSIGERTRSDGALRESEERYRDLFDNARTQLHHDLNGKYICKPSALELVGSLSRNSSEKTSSADPPEHAERIRETLQEVGG